MLNHNMAVWPGRPYPLGATWDGEGVNFSLFSERAERVELCLFDPKGRREIARIPLATPSGGPSRPRGVVITPDGRYAAITGAARGQPGSGVVWLLELATGKVAGRVTGVGNETYMLALVPGS